MNIAKVIFSQTNNPVRLLALACLLAMPATAQVNYAVFGGAAYVTSSPNASGNIVIASTYNGYPVTRIGGGAFRGRTNLTSVTIPNSVTNIGFQAFSDCTSLTNLSVDAANPAYSSVGGVLFNKVQTTLITFPAGLTGSYVIPNSVSSIGSYAFSGSSSLTNVTIPNNVSTILDSAFHGCTSLTSVTIPNSVTRILDSTFIGCTSLTGVSIPNSVTRIEDYAFYSCTSLTSVSIPNSVTSIGGYAFSGCASLTSVTIPNSVTSIGSYAFYYCTSLTNLSVAAANPAYSSFDGVLFNKAQTILIAFPAGRGGSYTTTPNSVTSIGDNAFRGCTSLKSVSISNSVTNIGTVAFQGCTSLTNAIIGNGVTSIGDGAFYDCTSLTNLSVDAANPAYSSVDGVLFDKGQTTLITFPPGRGVSYITPNSVTSIADSAFFGCTSVTSVSIPNSVTGIGSYAFSECISLTNLTFAGNAPSLDTSALDNVGVDATVYYYYGTTGWGPTFAGWPTMMLGAPAPQVGAGSEGVEPGGFGFTLNGVVNQTIVVEASTNLVNWQPIWTSTLSTLSTNFVDPDWVNHSHRFYRLRSN